MIRPLAALLCFALAALAASAAEPAFVPLASGSLGTVMAKDGDSAFDAVYFRGDALAGTPILSRLEPAVGTGASVPALAAGYSARWTGIITPTASGRFPLALRATAAATVSVDGKVVLRTDGSVGPAGQRAVASIEMLRARPYDFVVELHSPRGPAQITLEWAQPTALARSETSAPVAAEQRIGPADGATIGTGGRLENAGYLVESRPDGSVEVTRKSSGAHARFSPEFSVVHQPPGHESKLQPKGGKFENDGPVGKTNYYLPVWDKETDFLVAAQPRVRLHAEHSTAESSRITWHFPTRPEYTLEAAITLPAEGTEPQLTWRLQPQRAGQYSVGPSELRCRTRQWEAVPRIDEPVTACGHHHDRDRSDACAARGHSSRTALGQQSSGGHGGPRQWTRDRIAFAQRNHGARHR